MGVHYHYQSLPRLRSTSLWESRFAPSALEYYWLNRAVCVDGKRGQVRLIGARTHTAYVRFATGGGTVIPVALLRPETVMPYPWLTRLVGRIQRLRSRLG